MDILNSSIQELEKEYWPDQAEYPTRLVETCHKLRKVKIRELEIHDIIKLLIQDIGSKYLMPIVLDRMERNIFEEDEFDGSQFIESLAFFNDSIFVDHPEYHAQIINLLQRKGSEIEEVMGTRRYDRLVKKMKEKLPSRTI